MIDINNSYQQLLDEQVVRRIVMGGHVVQRSEGGCRWPELRVPLAAGGRKGDRLRDRQTPQRRITTLPSTRQGGHHLKREKKPRR